MLNPATFEQLMEFMLDQFKGNKHPIEVKQVIEPNLRRMNRDYLHAYRFVRAVEAIRNARIAVDLNGDEESKAHLEHLIRTLPLQ